MTRPCDETDLMGLIALHGCLMANEDALLVDSHHDDDGLIVALDYKFSFLKGTYRITVEKLDGTAVDE